MKTAPEATSLRNPEQVFAQRLLRTLEQQQIGHDANERLRVIRLAAIERAKLPSPLVAAQAQTQNATDNVNLGGVLGQFNPFGGHANWAKSFYILVPVAAFLAYWVTMGVYQNRAERSNMPLGVLSANHLSKGVALNIEQNDVGSLATNLMKDPLPPSAYADTVFLEYMDRQLAARQETNP